MRTVTLTFEPRISVPGDTYPVADVAGMLDMIDEHDTYVLANSRDDASSIVMLSDDEQTAWYVATLPELADDGLDVQVDTFHLSPEVAGYIVRPIVDDGNETTVTTWAEGREFTVYEVYVDAPTMALSDHPTRKEAFAAAARLAASHGVTWTTEDAEGRGAGPHADGEA